MAGGWSVHVLSLIVQVFESRDVAGRPYLVPVNGAKGKATGRVLGA